MIAYFVRRIAYLAHMIPLIEQLGGKIFTNRQETYDWVKAHTNYEVFFHEDQDTVFAQIVNEGFTNMIVGDKYENLPDINKFQIFHGVSQKSFMGRWKALEHNMIQAPHYLKGYIERHQGANVHICTFPRAIYYNNIPPNDHSLPYLVMFSHRDSGYKNLVENYKLAMSLDHPIVVKPHSISFTMPEVIDPIREFAASRPNVRFIEQSDPDFINYHNLFLNSSLMITDHSSVMYEYTLTNRPIVQLRGGPDPHPFPDKETLLRDKTFKADDRRLENAIRRALKCQISYPRIYFTKPDIVDVIRKNLK